MKETNMKRRKGLISGLIVASVICSTIVFPGNTVQAATSVKINSTNFPDKNFRAYVKSQFDEDANGVLNSTELKNAKRVECINSKIKNLQGIEKLVYATYLDCSENEINTLDLSSNVKLKTLNCSKNQLTSINITGCSNLVTLECFDNQLSALDVSDLAKLTKLDCSNNLIESLDVSNSINLTYLEFYNNKISAIDISKNTELDYLQCSDNQIKTLDVSSNTKLEELECSRNELDSLDVSTLSNLKFLGCRGNNLTAIDVSNNANLDQLYLEKNKLSTVDVSSNPDLHVLICSDNNLTSIEFGETSSLGILFCDNNKLTSLDLSRFDISYLYCRYNQLKTLKLKEDSGLQVLLCNDNELTELNLNNMVALHVLSVFHNNISSVDLSLTGISNSSWCRTYAFNPALKSINQCYIASDDIDSILEFLQVEDFDWEGLSRLNIDDEIIYYYRDILIVDNTTEVNGLPFDFYKPVSTPTPTQTPTPTTSVTPTAVPTGAAKPTVGPTSTPTGAGNNTVAPTTVPVVKPTSNPGVVPTEVVPTNTANPTSVPGTKPNGNSDSKPSNSPTNKPSVPMTNPDATSDNKSVEDFAERLYTTCLGRAAEKEGKAFWVSELKSGVPGSEVAQGFFFSPEFIGFNLDNEEYITRLYRTFMGREPDKDGIDYWSSQMKGGKDRKFVFDGFINSPEWADICLLYGIRSGGLATPTFEKEASAAVVAFAERLYTTCLGREAEKAGLEWWSAELANLRQTGTVAAQGFFFSPEFIGLKTDDEEYVTRLYRTFMGREPETAGFDFWVGELKSGKDRKYVFDGFSVAPEFANLCADAGILR